VTSARRFAGLLAAGVLAVATPAPLAAQAGGEVIAEITVHGNHISSDDDVRQFAGIAPGDPFGPTTLADIERRLRATGRFDDVDVLKRFASIADPSRITVVIVVNEGPVRIEMPGVDEPDAEPRVVRRRLFRNLMWLPVLSGEDGYGFTYGVQLAYVGLGHRENRLAFPLTWGGRREAGVEFSRAFGTPIISRVEVGAGLRRERNPGFDEVDNRRQLWGRVEHATGPLRAGATLGWQHVDFGQFDDELRTVGVDVAIDTRINPVMPRNAVFAQAAWERVDVAPGPTIRRVRLDGRGYLGLFGQNVLAVRGLREDGDRAQPAYLRPLLGGWSNLRGFEAGAFNGDTIVAGSAEVFVPLTSALEVGQIGVSAFVDAGAAYDDGQRLRDQPWRTGYGGSVWITFTAFRMSLAVAHGKDASTRVHFGGGFAF
jgi:outer membrane protein assembly factor BamA